MGETSTNGPRGLPAGRQQASTPIIALLSDFGLRDHYVGAMKGAILTVCPEAKLVDITHEIPAHDVLAGALTLEAAHEAFPRNSVFVAVVDPGVGSDRRAIALGTNDYVFVGPDNGVFTLILDAHPGARAHLLANPLLARPTVSAVFHGRDLFGPAAAHLARGLRLEDAGPAVPEPVRLRLPAKARQDDGWKGAVLLVDRFGNLTTNLLAADLDALAGEAGARLELVAGGRVLPLVRTYSDVAPGEPCALVGSSGRVEIAVSRGRAERLLQLAAGGTVTVRRAR